MSLAVFVNVGKDSSEFTRYLLGGPASGQPSEAEACRLEWSEGLSGKPEIGTLVFSSSFHPPPLVSTPHTQVQDQA